MKNCLKPLKKDFSKSLDFINDNLESFTLSKLVTTYKLDFYSRTDKDILVDDIDETTNLFNNLVMSYADKFARLEVRDNELNDSYRSSLLGLVLEDSKDLSIVQKYSGALNYDKLLLDTLKKGDVRILLVLQDNENYNLYFVKTYDILTDSDIKYINKVFNKIKDVDTSDVEETQQLLDIQHECGLKYNNKLKVLKQNQYVISQLAMFNKHFNDIVLATYQLELILN